uniref:ATP-binding cassette domain-containing protein n=1 Tax=uncultured Aureimonas sp. TaxID=1604662 RepID=UPI0025FCF147
LQAALHHLFRALEIAPLARAFERDARSGAALPSRLAALLSRHRLFQRSVLLRPDWERQDGPPLLAFLDAERRPVALVCRRRRWFVLDGAAERRLDPALSARLSDDAIQIYPSLPDEPFSFRDLFRFGLVGGGVDRLRLVGCLVAGAAFASLIPAAAALLVDDVLPRGDVRTAQLVAVGLVITVLARTVFEVVKGIVLLRSELRLEMRLQPALVVRMMRLPSSFYRSHAVGDILDRVLGTQQARQLLSQHGLGAIVGAAFSLVSLVPIMLVDWRLAVVTLAAALTLGLVTAALSYAELRHERRLIAQKGRLESFVLQVLMGMAKLRASAAEPEAFQRWARLFRSNLDHSIAAERWANVQRTVQTFLPELATIAIYAAIAAAMKSDALAAAADGSEAASAFPAGAFGAVSAAAAQVFGSITALADALSRTLGAIPMIERARPIIATPLGEPSGESEPLELKGEIDIRNLSFRYAPSSPLGLDGLDLRIGAGEFVAIVGASGSGKSTLMRLLLGFEQPASGEIFYDGTSLRRIALPDFRRQMGVVLQHGKLFSGSIHENITGQTGLGMDEAVAAARLVGLEGDIEAMPMGMHTVLLDGAATLSGGQRQRILIARALVGRPAVLLLDEAISALDNRTQAIVTQTLVGLAVTRVAIAHRLSTIEAADRIVVLQAGRVVETGSYAELMALGGHFASHARRQLL